ARRRVTIVWHPPVTAADVAEAVERQARDGAWSYGVLHDTRAITANTNESTQPLIDMVARLSKIHGPRGPVAVVAVPQTVGNAQAYAIRGARATVGTIEVFWDREEAEAWLDAETD